MDLDSLASGKRLHVTNLSRNVRAEHLEEIFGHFGKVTSVSLAVDARVGLSKGYGYVEFASHDDADQAQQCLDAGALDGNKLKVSFVVAGRANTNDRSGDVDRLPHRPIYRRRDDSPPRRYRPQPRVYRRVAYSRSRSPRHDRKRRWSRSESSDSSSYSRSSDSFSSSSSSHSYSSRSSSASSSVDSARDDRGERK